MSRVPSILGNDTLQVPATSWPQVNPPVDFSYGIDKGLQAFAQTFDQMGQRRAAADRARTLTDFESNALTAVDAARTAAEAADPAQAENIYNQHDSLRQLKDQARSIPDEFTRLAAQRTYAELTTHGLLGVKSSAARRAGEAARQSNENLLEQYGGAVGTGLDAAVAIGRLQDSVTAGIGSAYTQGQAEAFMRNARRGLFSQQAEYLLESNPELVADFLKRPEVAAAVTPPSRRAIQSAADQAIQEHDAAAYKVSLSTAATDLDTELARTGSNAEDFTAMAQDRSKVIASLPGNPPGVTEQDILIHLLSSPLEAAARAADVNRFEILASAMPENNSKASILLSENLDRLEATMRDRNRSAALQQRVDSAIAARWPLDRNLANQEGIDADAVTWGNSYATQHANDQQPDAEKAAAAMRAAVDRYGPTGLLPSSITQRATATASVAPESLPPGALDLAMSTMTYVRSAAPLAYDSFDHDTRTFHDLYQEMQLPGGDPAATAKAVHEAITPSNPAAARALRAVSGGEAQYALSQLGQRISKDATFGKLDVLTEKEVRPLPGSEAEAFPRFDLSAISALIPPEMTQKYLDWYLVDRHTMTREAAAADAYQHLVDSRYGVTSVFKKQPVVRVFSPERDSGLETKAIERDIAWDLAAAEHDTNLENHIAWDLTPNVEPFPEWIAHGELKFAADDESYLKKVNAWAREHLDLTPPENPQDALRSPGGRIAYALDYLDANRIPHPLYRRLTDPQTGHETVERIFVVVGAGITARQAQERQVAAPSVQSFVGPPVDEAAQARQREWDRRMQKARSSIYYTGP